MFSAIVEIITINKTGVFGRNNFQVRTVIVKPDSNINQEWQLELTHDNVNLGDEISPNKKYLVHFHIRGNQFTTQQGKTIYEHKLNAYKFDPIK